MGRAGEMGEGLWRRGKDSGNGGRVGEMGKSWEKHLNLPAESNTRTLLKKHRSYTPHSPSRIDKMDTYIYICSGKA